MVQVVLSSKGFVMTVPAFEPPEKVDTHVMIVTDDLDSGNAWSYSLGLKGYGAIVTEVGEDVVEAWGRHSPDLIVIDLHSQEIKIGVDICQKLRSETTVPILLFLPRTDEEFLLEGYSAGADECQSSSMSPPVFLAKVRAWLRRSNVIPAEALGILEVGGLRFDPAHRQVLTAPGMMVRLTNLESRLLYLLMTNPGWVLETDYLISRVWGFMEGGDSTLLKNIIYRLRKKIEPDPAEPRRILTEPGIGYRFQDL